MFWVAFCPEGKTLANGGADKTVKLWNSSTGALKQTLTAHTGEVWAGAFSPDGRTLASGDEDRRVVDPPVAPADSGCGRPAKEVDLRPGFEKRGLFVQCRRRRPTCSVHTFTRALEFARSRERDKGVSLSDEFANWAYNQVIGNVGPSATSRGQFSHNLWMGCAECGTCRERYMPFAPKFDPSVEPSPAAIRDAARLRESRLRWQYIYGRSDGEVIRKAKGVLAKGWPIMAGSHHSVLLVGYVDNPGNPGGGHFITMDSGADHGKGAYGAVSYSMIRDYGLCCISVPED